MAKMTCKCGNELSNVESPNEVELKVYTDKEWDEIMEIDTLNTWEIPLPKYDVWRCPKCERIYVFNEKDNKASRVYSLEK